MGTLWGGCPWCRSTDPSKEPPIRFRFPGDPNGGLRCANSWHPQHSIHSRESSDNVTTTDDKAKSYYFTVKNFGRPTPDNAPHGYKWRKPTDISLNEWQNGPNPYKWSFDMQWHPLDPPPTTEAPAPEPVARWVVSSAGLLVRDGSVQRAPNLNDQRHLASIANTLDRDGVVYGPGRPPEELPPLGKVLAQWASGSVSIEQVEYLRGNQDFTWFHLPEGSRP